jgi:hypothetical protein
MGKTKRPSETVSIDTIGLERLSREKNESYEQIGFSINIGNPKSFYIRITRRDFELKGRWTGVVTGIAGVIGLIKLLF